MPKFTVPGASSATGKREFPTYSPGLYTFQCDSCELKETKKGDGVQAEFKLSIIEAPEQMDGRDVQGKAYTHRLWIPKEIHPRYDEFIGMAANRLKEMAIAFGIRIRENDEVDTDAFPGKTAKASMRIKEGKDMDGTPRKENEIVKWRPDDNLGDTDEAPAKKRKR